MRFYPYLCFGGLEVANADRTRTYMRAGFGGSIHAASTGNGEFCDGLLEYIEEDGYFTISGDPAPWYEANIPASEEFLGMIASRIEALPIIGRTATNRVPGGGFLTPMREKVRAIQVQGTLVAASERGMAYGTRWLNEVLRGSRCPSGCAADEAIFLPACPDDGDDVTQSFRRTLDTGLVDGPTTSPVGTIPECNLLNVTFQLASGQSYLFGEPVEDLAATDLSTNPSVLVSTNEWIGDKALIITLEAQSAATNIVIENRVSFDGTCDNLEGMPCWRVAIPAMGKNDTITFDATRRQIRFRDPALKVERSGVHLLDFEGPLTWPEVAPCTDVCVQGSIGTGDVTMTVQSVTREI